MRIDRIDPKTIAAGVITCSKCESSGPINVIIMDEKLIPNPFFSNRNGQ